MCVCLCGCSGCEGGWLRSSIGLRLIGKLCALNEVWMTLRPAAVRREGAGGGPNQINVMRLRAPPANAKGPVSPTV